jgi:hypothetical protein
MATNTGGPAPIYGNPFRGAHVSASRVDMGYDAIGKGSIFALGPGIITEADHAWSGAIGAPVPGTFIVERITEGPLKGRDIYYAEDIISSVRKGQRVDMSTVIGQFTGTGSGEFGYAYGTGGETLAAHFGQDALGRAQYGDPGHYSTAYGVAFANVIEKLGGPHDSITPPIQGTVPKKFPGAGDVNSPVQTDSFLSSLLGNLLGFGSATDMLERVGLVIFGAFLILVGVWLLAGKQTLHVATETAKVAAVA